MLATPAAGCTPARCGGWSLTFTIAPGRRRRQGGDVRPDRVAAAADAGLRPCRHRGGRILLQLGSLIDKRDQRAIARHAGVDLQAAAS